MGPVSFGAALIAAPKSLNGSLDVTLFELEHRTSGFASWDIGRHVLQVGTLDVMFGELGYLNWIFGSFCDLCGIFLFSNITLRHSLLEVQLPFHSPF
jgi:hypothetical protein